MKASAFLLAFVWAGFFITAPAAEILVTKGTDATDLVPPPDSLRAAVQNAKSGDTIRFASPLTVLLEGSLNVPNNIVGLRIQGPGQIRGRPFRDTPHGTTQEFEVFNVSADGVTLDHLNFRNCAVNFGGTGSSRYIQGATISNCTFTQDGSLELAQVENGVIQDNRFEHSNTLFVASITLDHTRSCRVVGKNIIENAGIATKSEGVLSLFDENLTIDGVVSNRGFYVASISGVIRNNILKSSSLVVNTSLLNGTNMLVENNEAKRLFAKGVNLILRKNKLSPRGDKPIEKEIRKAPKVPEEDLGVALRVEALNNEAGVPSGPVLIEENIITGGRAGILLFAGIGLTEATVHKNTITGTDREGIIVNQTVPVTVTENIMEKCGAAGIYLRDIATTEVLVADNMITNSRKAGIVVNGNPVVKNNTITGGKAKGFIIAAGATAQIEGNTVEEMSEGGVFVASGADVILSGITLRRNGQAGIIVEKGAILTSFGATIENNLGPGIVFRAQSQGSVVGGSIHDNKGAGINLVNGAMAEIRNASFSGNRGPGIDIAPGGVTQNDQLKKANGDIDFPTALEYDDSARLIRGKAEAGALVQLFKVEDGLLSGNKQNGEGASFIGETTTTGTGEFAIAPGPAQKGDLFTLTATLPGVQPVTSEFSVNIEVSPTPPIEAISVSSNEEFGNGVSEVAGLNSDSNRTVTDNGRFVLFSSRASNLVIDDTNGLDDLFLRDRMNGTTERVNLSSTGGQVTGGSIAPHVEYGSISGDGRFVAFTSEAGMLVNSTLIAPNVFLRDRQTNTTVAVTQVADAPPGTDPLRSGGNSSISADGSTVAFTSIDDFVPSNFGYDLFIWRRLTGEFALVNVAAAGGTDGTLNELAANPRLSSTGRYVAFVTIRPLVGTDTNNSPDVYVRDTESGTTELVSADDNGQAVAGGTPSISADGRYVAFATSTSRDAGDTNGKPDIYLRDRQDGTLHWVSPPPVGGFGVPNMNRGCSSPSISADGRFIAFQASGSSLRPDSITLLVEDVFVYDRVLGKTVEVSLGVNGDDARGDSVMPTLSGDGRTVVFRSDGRNLVPGDTNNTDDIFARDVSRDFDE